MIVKPSLRGMRIEQGVEAQLNPLVVWASAPEGLELMVNCSDVPRVMVAQAPSPDSRASIDSPRMTFFINFPPKSPESCNVQPLAYSG